MKLPAGDDDVGRLFDAHFAALVLYARQWFGAATADDVVQRVFVRLLRGGKLPNQPRSWLFRCVRNEAMAVWRAELRRGRREQAVALSAGEWFEGKPDDLLSADEAQRALESLSSELREVVTLRLWGDLTLSEIAEITEVAVSTVHNRYTAAIELLREKLEIPCKSQKS
jgi:RNA polymerase sigma-70 factor (ECF subfamily)